MSIIILVLLIAIPSVLIYNKIKKEKKNITPSTGNGGGGGSDFPTKPDQQPEK